MIGLVGGAVTLGGLLVPLQNASAHTPHDDTLQVLVSPQFGTDGVILATVRGRLFRTADGGAHWGQIVKGLDRPSVERIAGTPIDKNVVYMVHFGGIYRSNDQGWSWSKTAYGKRNDLADVIVSPLSANVVFASSKSSGLFRSLNGGAVWTKVAGVGTVSAMGFAADGRLFVGESTGRLAASTDNGVTWAVASGVPAGQSVSTVHSPVDAPSVVFAGLQDGHLLRSVDAGSSFQPVGGALPLERVTGVATSGAYATDHTLWVTTWKGLFRSQDDGGSFVPARAGVKVDGQADEYGEAQFNGIAVTGTPAAPILFLGAYDGLFRSNDRAKLWTEVQTHTEQVTGLDVSPDYALDHSIIATTYIKGAYTSRDGGNTWQPGHVGLGSLEGNEYSPVERLHNAVYSPAYATDGTIFTSTAFSLAKSTDRGVSWRLIKVEAGAPRHVVAMSPQFATDGTIYLGSVSGAVWRSTARGEPKTFTQIANVGSRIRSIVLSPAYPADPTMYVGTVTKGIFKSSDGGVTWQQMGPAAESMMAISPNYAVDRTVFAGTPLGLYVSRDAGTTWVKLGRTPLSSGSRIEAVAVSPNFAADGTVLVSVTGRGLFRSTDRGQSFKAVGQNLLDANLLIFDYEQPTAEPIQFSPAYATDRTIFGFTEQHVVRSTDGGDTWTALSLPSVQEFFQPPAIVSPLPIASVAEGGAGTDKTLTIAVDLTHPSWGDVAVSWQTVDQAGYASSTSDYRAASGTLSLPKGSTRGLIKITVRGDTTKEADEPILVRLSNPAGATLAVTDITGMIVNDD